MGRLDSLSVLNKCAMECVNVTAVAVNITDFLDVGLYTVVGSATFTLHF